MNQTQNCMTFRTIFKEEKSKLIYLKIAYALSIVLTLAANIKVITTLSRQKKKTRSTKLFLLLSASDLMVGCITIPLTMVLFYTDISEHVYCKLVPLIVYFIYAPVNFSWTTTIVIALDRVLMVTKNHLHYKYMTKKVICMILISNFCMANGMSLWNLFTVKFSKKILDINPFNITISVLEICFICLTAVFYLYLLWFVRRQSKVMDHNRITDTKESYSSRTTRTTIYVFICLVVCNFTQLFGMIYVIWTNTENSINVRNIIFWTLLSLYLNSFLNATILILRGLNTGKKKKSVPLATLAHTHMILNVNDDVSCTESNAIL